MLLSLMLNLEWKLHIFCTLNIITACESVYNWWNSVWCWHISYPKITWQYLKDGAAFSLRICTKKSVFNVCQMSKQAPMILKFFETGHKLRVIKYERKSQNHKSKNWQHCSVFINHDHVTFKVKAYDCILS